MVRRPTITAHMIVKNEDQWVWYAVQSVLPYVDQFLITDTGSTDHTLAILRTIHSPKIVLDHKETRTGRDVTKVRTEQLAKTKTDWFWVVDADEIYPEATAREVVAAIRAGQYEGVSVRRYDLLGDVYHRQKESVGTYRMFGVEGHLVLRALSRRRLPGLALQGDYPLEGYYDQDGRPVLEHDPSLHKITKGTLYHAMYLKRSSQGAQLSWMPNRSKYKIETGLPVPGPLPEVFSLPRPPHVPDPLARRSLAYELAARVLTPIKNLKRSL